jgi:hypothetical protein
MTAAVTNAAVAVASQSATPVHAEGLRPLPVGKLVRHLCNQHLCYNPHHPAGTRVQSSLTFRPAVAALVTAHIGNTWGGSHEEG